MVTVYWLLLNMYYYTCLLHTCIYYDLVKYTQMPYGVATYHMYCLAVYVVQLYSAHLRRFLLLFIHIVYINIRPLIYMLVLPKLLLGQVSVLMLQLLMPILPFTLVMSLYMYILA